MMDYQKLADDLADRSRRQWAGRHFLMAEAAKEIPDVQTMIDELDADWEAMERLHVRIRHHVRRLQNKLATNGQPLSENDRSKVYPRGGE